MLNPKFHDLIPLPFGPADAGSWTFKLGARRPAVTMATVVAVVAVVIALRSGRERCRKILDH